MFIQCTCGWQNIYSSKNRGTSGSAGEKVQDERRHTNQPSNLKSASFPSMHRFLLLLRMQFSPSELLRFHSSRMSSLHFCFKRTSNRIFQPSDSENISTRTEQALPKTRVESVVFMILCRSLAIRSPDLTAECTVGMCNCRRMVSKIFMRSSFEVNAVLFPWTHDRN